MTDRKFCWSLCKLSEVQMSLLADWLTTLNPEIVFTRLWRRINQSLRFNSGLRLHPCGLDHQGLFDFIFPWMDFLPGWAIDFTAERTARLPCRLFPVCRPQPTRYHRGTRQSNQREIKLTSSDRKQRATCWEHGQSFCGFLTKAPDRPRASRRAVDMDPVCPVRGFILVMSRLRWRMVRPWNYISQAGSASPSS